MKKIFALTTALVAIASSAQSNAATQEVITPLKGNVTITQRYYSEADILANIETAAGASTDQGSPPALTIINDPHKPAYNPLTGEWVEDGPVLTKSSAPQSLRDRVRSKMTN